jgi:putative RNA 2'-phosphotransferase
VTSILHSGLNKGKRHQVHLSADIQTARKVGQRKGKPVVFRVEALKMHERGLPFFVSENGVWLTDHVPVEYLIAYLESR